MNRSTINMAGRLRLRRRSRGWLVVATAAAAVALPAATALSVAAAAPGASFAAYGADGTGTGVHVRVGTDAFPNFANGVVDNAYPLAVVHLDASPAAKATASVADTGPLGATAAGQAGTQQPQYADAAYPGTPSASKSTGASVADAGATETNADARSTLTAAPPPAPGSSTVPVPAPAPGLPAAPAVPSVPSAPAVPAPGGSTGTGNSGPFAVSNGVGEAHAVLDRAAGLLRATSIGSVSRATFANGLLAVEGVTVRVEARSDGAAGTTDSAIDVGRITVAGKNVALTDKGIVAADTPVPGVPTEAVTAQLRDALAKAGITLFSVAPVVDVQGASATIAATGLHVKVAQPPTAPGVPAQTVEYVIGEARASAFATPASPAPTSLDGATPPVPARTDPLAGTATPNTSTSDPSATLSDGGDSESSLSGFEAASTTASPASRSKSAAGAGSRKGVLARVLHTKPRYLLFAFLAWLCLIWGTAVALLRSRRIQLALAEVIDAH